MHSNVCTRPSVKLPTIEIPKLDGNLADWLYFRDTFESLIHNNESITDIQKFHYLKASLFGTAGQIVKSLEFSSANYPIAWNALCGRFNCNKLLIHNHIKAIFEIEKVKKESAGEIQSIADTLSKHLQALKTLNQPVDSWDAIIIYIIAGKLDQATLRAWETERSGIVESPKLEEFTGFLGSRAQFLHTLEIKNQQIPQSANGTKNATKTKAFITSESRKGCVFCKGDHFIQHCSEFTKLDPRVRSDKSKEFKLCLNCLRPGHFISDCRLRSCKKCNGRHNTLLHFDRTPAPASNGSTVALYSNIKQKCRVELAANHSEFKISMDCLIVPSITGDLPSLPIDRDKIDIPSHLRLADPTFHSPGPIDLLLGGQWFWGLMCVGQVPINSLGLVLQKTKLGWVAGGPLQYPNQQSGQCLLTRHINIDENLQKFWELEEVGTNKSLSDPWNECERIFANTFKRDAEGRFVVTIPLKEDPKQLGRSKHTAERRLLNLERKFKRQPDLRRQYASFLDEYERLGHMSLVKDEVADEIAFYLPHHCVIKPDSTSTKIRVVFDGSAATSNGKSLNDIQMVGPVLQSDLFDILIRFRKHPCIVSADIEKMYRQVLIDPQQRSLQRILWRSDPKEPIKTYNLNTVTYGTASASFLSIRAVVQLAVECKDELPKIADVILNDFYVDDLLTGAESIEEAKLISKNITKVLEGGCFHLRKWASNEPEVIADLVNNDPHCAVISLDSDVTQKTLGLKWDTKADILNFAVKNNGTSGNRVTKRQILTEVAQIFDPLGLVGPSIIVAKIILQMLWREKIAWDESVTLQLHQEWTKYRSALKYFNQLKIPRFISCRGVVFLQLHGFVDASKAAYGACIYIRTQDQAGNVRTKLLCSKSRVAPLKTQTIPRLELCGALLLAKLMTKTRKALKRRVDGINYWTDSTIVLAWLRLSPSALPIFISNRVSQIQEESSIDEWRHVPTKLNPADCLSRGLNPKELINHDLWWNGPAFLSDEPSQWPNLATLQTESEEKLDPPTIALNIVVTENNLVKDLSNRTSEANKMVRVLAYVNRFIQRLKGKQVAQSYLRAAEINEALITLIKMTQKETFSDELKILQEGKAVTKGRMALLSPFLDDRGIVRVGGRLANSQFSIDKKHPIILDSSHKVTVGIVLDEHKELLHAGPQHLLASVREKYWPIRGRNLVRKIVKNCITCSKTNPKPYNFIMGNLPDSRVSPASPFTNTGIDYAGPFLIKDKKGRGSKLTKCYIALFGCFATKALHIELVSDLTSQAFIAALRRFIVRRGKPQNIYSDNGSTFIGAHNELQELGRFLKNEMENLGESIENLGVNWHFIPPYSPHQGGIWEAGVKSVKTHLKRIAGNARLLFEELYTLLAQIEAVLNSRPLCPLSNDPNDLNPITPAHFLIGRPYTAAPDPSVLHLNEGRLSSWQRVQSLQQHLWARWQKEYIAELQQRTKWNKPYPSIEEGALVLIKEDNLPPARWKLGRITAKHPGNDEVTRVASVRTSTGTIRRALTKLCPLPIERGEKTD